MKRLLKELKEIFFPKSFTCDICGIETFGSNLCPTCAKKVTFNDKSTCPVCGRKTKIPQLCPECKEIPPQYKKGVSALVYENGAVTLIHKYKNGCAYLKDRFSEILANKIEKFPKADGFVFVPMTKKSVRKRGYNQSELLAKSLSERTGIPVVNIVKKVKDTPEQKSLSRTERIKNLSGCFKVSDKKSAKDKIFIIVDDVLTTGSTADAISRELLKAGAKQTFLATVASVEYDPSKNQKKTIDNQKQI